MAPFLGNETGGGLRHWFSEAPSPTSALLSGVLLNCAYLGIFETNKIIHAASLGDFSGTILIVSGLTSILAAAIFILKQTEYKRLLAYSSIEKMGIIVFGTGSRGADGIWSGALSDSPQPDQVVPVAFIGEFTSRLRQPIDRGHREDGKAHTPDVCGVLQRFCRHLRFPALRQF